MPPQAEPNSHTNRVENFTRLLWKEAWLQGFFSWERLFRSSMGSAR